MRSVWMFLALAGVPAVLADEPEPQLKFLGTLEGTLPHSRAAIAFSPDGKLLATTDYKDPQVDAAEKYHPGHSLIKLWDVGSRKVSVTLRSHTNAVISLAFSRDGKTLVSSGDGGKDLKLWDVTTGKEKAPLKIDPTWVFLALSPDGKTIAFAKEGNRDAVSVTDPQSPIAFAKDGKPPVILWDVVTGKESKGKEKVSLKGFSGLPGPAAISPDGTLYALGSGRFGSEGLPGAGEVKLWDLTTGRERATLKGHLKLKVSLHELSYLHKAEGVPKRVLLKVSGLNGMEFQSEENIDEQLAKALEKILDKDQREKYLKVLSTRLGTTHFEGPEVVWSVAFSPDGKTLASASVLGSVLLWDVQSGKRKLTLQRFNVDGREEDINQANSVAFSPDGKLLAVGTWRGGVKLWDVKTGESLGGVNRPLGTVWSVAFSADGKTIASAGSKGVVGRRTARDSREADPILRLWEWMPAKKAEK